MWAGKAGVTIARNGPAGNRSPAEPGGPKFLIACREILRVPPNWLEMAIEGMPRGQDAHAP